MRAAFRINSAGDCGGSNRSLRCFCGVRGCAAECKINNSEKTPIAKERSPAIPRTLFRKNLNDTQCTKRELARGAETLKNNVPRGVSKSRRRSRTRVARRRPLPRRTENHTRISLNPFVVEIVEPVASGGTTLKTQGNPRHSTCS